MAKMINKDNLIAEFACRLDDSVETFPTKNVIKMIEAQTEEEVIPIAVIERAIAGFSLADQCDQGGAWNTNLLHALETVLDWYGTPEYERMEGVAIRPRKRPKTVVNQRGRINYYIERVDELNL